jgi:hypothetical protein
LIQHNISTLKSGDEKDKVIQKMVDMKNWFNEVVKSKADLQQELINSEEEKLKISKALIELQIINANMVSIFSLN